MKVLVITDTQEEIKELNKKNFALIPGLFIRTQKNLVGSKITIIFATAYSLLDQGGTCGMSVDAVINLSTADIERLREILGPCLI